MTDLCPDCRYPFDENDVLAQRAAENPSICRSCADVRIEIACDEEQALLERSR
jgi:hypothetical protein